MLADTPSFRMPKIFLREASWLFRASAAKGRVGACAAKGQTPPAKRVASGWTTDELVSWLVDQGLGRLEDTIRRLDIDGAVLSELRREDLREELGRSGLEAAKILSKLP